MVDHVFSWCNFQSMVTLRATNRRLKGFAEKVLERRAIDYILHGKSICVCCLCIFGEIVNVFLLFGIRGQRETSRFLTFCSLRLGIWAQFHADIEIALLNEMSRFDPSCLQQTNHSAYQVPGHPAPLHQNLRKSLAISYRTRQQNCRGLAPAFQVPSHHRNQVTRLLTRQTNHRRQAAYQATSRQARRRQNLRKSPALWFRTRQPSQQVLAALQVPGRRGLICFWKLYLFRIWTWKYQQ
jgi:hypothetical protein